MTKSEVAEKLIGGLRFVKTPKGTVLDPGSDVLVNCKWNNILLKHIGSLIVDEEEIMNLLFLAYLKDHWNDSVPPKTT